MPRESANPGAASASIYDVTSTNRANWNRIAPEREGRPAAYFRDGGSTLEAYERELAGDVTGKRVLHLACSTGDEVLSWARLGAIAKARRKVTEILTVRGENRLTVTGENFGRGVPRNSPDFTKRLIGVRQEDDAAPFAAFAWPVGEVMMGLFEGSEPAIHPELGEPSITSLR